MKNKSFDSQINPDAFDSKNIGVRHSLNRHDPDFFDESKNTVEKVIRVKRFQSSNKSERWKIIEDNKVVFIVEGSKLSNKEKEYLRSVDGFGFLISQYKEGIKSFNKLKMELKKKL